MARVPIWPWLVQLGYQRGGLYSYDWLDGVFGFLDRPSSNRVLPEFQISPLICGIIRVMHGRSSKRDAAQNALRVVEEAIGAPLKQEPKKPIRFKVPTRAKNPAAVALGKLGGAKGGRARSAKLSAAERKEIAQRAAQARWAKEKSES